VKRPASPGKIPAPRSEDAPPALITVEGIGAYLTCHRAWWLADVKGYAPGGAIREARATLAQRRWLARRLMIGGGGLIGLAVLLLALGLLVF
jgi:hypothetical protein